MPRTIVRATWRILLAVAVCAPALRAQEHPARRLANIVGVAIEEYGKGIDDRGRQTSAQEYDEAVSFLRDARDVAERLSGDGAAATRAELEALTAAVAAKRPPEELRRIHERFIAALGAEGALELPREPINLAAGREIYARDCASCHGERGLGDGAAGLELVPRPPAIASAAGMKDATPALLYRVISVGVSGTPMPGWAGSLSAQQRWNVVAYLHAMRSSTADRLEGEGLFLQRCASCHGALGAGDAVSTRALTKLPPEIGGFSWQAERSDAQIAAVVRAGVSGTAMPAARDLSEAEVAKVVAYVRSLPARRGEATIARAADTTAAGVSRLVLVTLDQALAAAQAGRTGDAGDKAFDAYLAFEPLETTARAKKPGLVASMERHFAEFKGAAKAGDLRAAQRSRDAIELQLPEVVDLTQRTSNAWSAFLQSFLIILREGFEAILVIGAVATFLIKTGNGDKLRSLWVGAVLAVAASAVTAVILSTMLHAVPASREIIEGVTLLIAVAVLFSVSYWLISKVEAAKWQQFIKDKVNTALAHGGGRALSVVAFLAVYREGAETALFYQALFSEGPHVALPLSLGILVGFATLAVIFVGFYRFGVKIPLRPFFAVTSGLLYYMAFVFLGTGIRELQEGNVLPITPIPGLPTVPAMGLYPTVETLLAQLFLLALLAFALMKTFWPKRSVALPTAPDTRLSAPVADVAVRVTQLQDAILRVDQRLSALERRVADESTLGGAATRSGTKRGVE